MSRSPDVWSDYLMMYIWQWKIILKPAKYDLIAKVKEQDKKGGDCGREADSSDEVGKGEALEEKQMRWRETVPWTDTRQGGFITAVLIWVVEQLPLTSITGSLMSSGKKKKKRNRRQREWAITGSQTPSTIVLKILSLLRSVWDHILNSCCTSKLWQEWAQAWIKEDKLTKKNTQKTHAHKACGKKRRKEKGVKRKEC